MGIYVFGPFSKLSTGTSSPGTSTPHTPGFSKSCSSRSLSRIKSPLFPTSLLAKHHVTLFTRSQWTTAINLVGQCVPLDVDLNGMPDATTDDFRVLPQTHGFRNRTNGSCRVQFAGGQCQIYSLLCSVSRFWKRQGCLNSPPICMRHGRVSSSVRCPCLLLRSSGKAV